MMTQRAKKGKGNNLNTQLVRRWENIEIHVLVKKERNEDGRKEQKKKQSDKI